MYNRNEERNQGFTANSSTAIPTTAMRGGRGVSYPIIHEEPNMLADLYEVLGKDAVLIPYHKGTKKPMGTGWQKTTVEDTRQEEYIRELSNNNVGVLLGENGGNLVVVDCDDEEFSSAFFESNKDLCGGSLISKGNRGLSYWFRIKGDYPDKVRRVTDLQGEDVGEWRGGGGSCSIIRGTHPEGMLYRMIGAKVAEIEFDEIRWPEGFINPWQVPVDEEIAGRVGPAFDLKKEGSPCRINAGFFAELVMACLDLIFDEIGGSFYIYDPETGVWKACSQSAMTERAWLVARQWIEQQRSEYIAPLKAMFTQHVRRDIVSMIMSKAIEEGFFTKGLHYGDRHLYFHTLDGMMLCRPEHGEKRITYQTMPWNKDFRSLSRFNCRYVENPQCPKFDALVESAFGEDQVPIVLKILGYLLTDGNPGQRVVVIRGGAGTGKSQLATVLRGILPEGAWGELRTSQLDGRFEIGSFANKRLVYGPDVKSDFFCVDGARNIKTLTGGDAIEGELKFSNRRIEMVGDKHVLVTANPILRLAPGEDIGAWKRRLIVLQPVNSKIDKKVLKLGEIILAEERDAVFSKLMNAAYLALVELHRDGDLVVPDCNTLLGSGGVVLLGDVGEWLRRPSRR